MTLWTVACLVPLLKFLGKNTGAVTQCNNYFYEDSPQLADLELLKSFKSSFLETLDLPWSMYPVVPGLPVQPESFDAAALQTLEARWHASLSSFLT